MSWVAAGEIEVGAGELVAAAGERWAAAAGERFPAAGERWAAAGSRGGGGGVLGLIVLVLFMFFGGGTGTGDITSSAFDTSQVTGGGANADTSLFDHCKTGADANRDVNCRIVGTVNSVQAYWTSALPQMSDDRQSWTRTTTVLYSGTTRSACGTASNQVGPFY